MENPSPTQPMQLQPPKLMVPNNQWKTVTIVLSVVLLVAIIFGLYLSQKRSIGKEAPNQNALPTKTNSINISKDTHSSVPVVIYTEQIKTTSSESRAWPTVKILWKIGNAQPDTLAEVGKIGEYPNSYQLSPDKKSLLINLESKLQILDLTTKELRDLFIPKRQVLSMTYSPDGTQLFIWDQKYAPRDGDNSYYVHRFTIANRKDEILKQGVSESPFFGSAWREDGKVILDEAHGEFSTPHYFDLKNNQITRTPGNYASGLLSMSGKAMAVVKDWTDDVCNEFSGDAPNMYNIIDPVSGKNLGTVGSPNNRVSILAFSPNDTEIFYQTEKPWTNREDCNKTAEKSYLKALIGTNQVVLINNPAELLRSWNRNYVGATTSYDYKNRSWSILINDKAFITSNSELLIAGEYYQ
jgi:hypothetical protein